MPRFRSPFPSLVAALVLAAPATTAAESGPPRLEGSWVGTITATDPPLGSFQNLVTFDDSGTVLESRRLYVPATPFGSLLETGGHGAWEKQGGNDYAARFTFLLQGAPDNTAFAGQAIGTDNIALELSLDGTNRLIGT